MNVIIFGASGMVGRGVLLECLDDPEVASVRSVGRSPVGVVHDKLTEIAHADLLDLSPIADQLAGLDACFWCLGVSAAGLDEAQYRRITRDFTVAAATALLELNPNLAMVFVSGQGADSSEQGSVMWARIKGAAENALLAMPFSSLTIFRPGYIQPLRGVTSKTRSYRIMYTVLRPVQPLIKLLLGARITSTVAIGRAMLQAARAGTPMPILSNRDINALAAQADAAQAAAPPA